MPQYPFGAFAPGMFVRHPDYPEWGIGQVQSAREDRVTVTFEHVGKMVMNTLLAPLEEIADDALDVVSPPAHGKALE